MPEHLEAARSAYDLHAWAEVVESLEAADAAGGLSADDLLMLGDALWWTGEPEEALQQFERAYATYHAEGQIVDAASTAALLAYFAIRKRSFAVAGGWIGRVEELLKDQPESVGHAWLKILHLGVALFERFDLPKATQLADEAIELSQRFDAASPLALAMSFKGLTLIHGGDWRAGINLIDQATVVAMSEKADLRSASDVYCNTIAACANLSDYRRASEWTEQAERWMNSNSVTGYTGVCQVHRAQLKRLHGSWGEAEEEAKRACVELERVRMLDAVGEAHYEIGEVRRHMGDLEGAEQSYRRANEYGHKALPGLALLMMEKGDVQEAAQTINGALERRAAAAAQAGKAIPSRGLFLPAQAEIALAAGDVDTASKAVAELEMIADQIDGGTWRANALSARGALEMSEGNLESAIDALEEAWREWLALDLPFQSARARAILGEAYLAMDREYEADLEFSAARSTFQRLGAARALDQINRLTGQTPGVSAKTSARVTTTFMFTDIVTSTDLVGVIGDEEWEDLLEWHDAALRSEIDAVGGTEVRHTGDGIFASFPDPRKGVDCAVSIQRTLEDHRRASGFALKVRIGLHTTEATKRGSDYAGHGVHVAARVADAAGAGEVVVSEALVVAAGPLPYRLSKPESVSLKGVADPVAIMRIDWQA